MLVRSELWAVWIFVKPIRCEKEANKRSSGMNQAKHTAPLLECSVLIPSASEVPCLHSQLHVSTVVFDALQIFQGLWPLSLYVPLVQLLCIFLSKIAKMEDLVPKVGVLRTLDLMALKSGFRVWFEEKHAEAIYEYEVVGLEPETQSWRDHTGMIDRIYAFANGFFVPRMGGRLCGRSSGWLGLYMRGGRAR